MDSVAFVPVARSLRDLLGAEYVEAVGAAHAFLHGTTLAQVWQGDQAVEFYPAAMQERLAALLPQGMHNTLKALGDAALPCALLAMGAGLTLDSVKAKLRPAIIGTLLKLLVMPLLGYGLALLLGIQGEILVAALLLLAAPCAVASYVMADQMGADCQLAAATIALSTLLCLPIMALILWFSQA